MDISRFRTSGHEIIDWVADYLETIEGRPVRARVAPGEIDQRLLHVVADRAGALDKALLLEDLAHRHIRRLGRHRLTRPAAAAAAQQNQYGPGTRATFIWTHR